MVLLVEAFDVSEDSLDGEIETNFWISSKRIAGIVTAFKPHGNPQRQCWYKALFTMALVRVVVEQCQKAPAKEAEIFDEGGYTPCFLAF